MSEWIKDYATGHGRRRASSKSRARKAHPLAVRPRGPLPRPRAGRDSGSQHTSLPRISSQSAHALCE